MAARVGANKAKDGGRPVPKGGWDPMCQHMLGILAKNAKARPKLMHFCFTDTDVSQIALAKMDRVVNHPPQKAPAGGKLLDEQALCMIVQRMTSTEDQFKLTMGMVMTPQAYSNTQLIFEERVFQTFKAIQSGFMKMAFLGAWGRQGFFDTKYEYILIIIATLSLSDESVYSAFRHNLPNLSSWEAPKSLAGLLGLD